jgi:hypothetical protein
MDPTRVKSEYSGAFFEKALGKEVKNSCHHFSGVHRFNGYVVGIHKIGDK